MKKILTFTLALYIMGNSVMAAKKTKLLFKNPCIQVPLVKSMADKKIAAKFPLIPIFTNMNQEHKEFYKTSFKIIAHEKALHITVYCDEAPVWKSTLKGHDQQYWEEDSIEIFLSTGNKKYIHYVINTSGDIYDERGGVQKWNGMADKEWNGTALVKVEHSPRKWLAKIIVKPEDLELERFSKNMTLYGNIIRNIGCNQDKRVWANLGTSFHQPEFFGKFVIEDPKAVIYGSIEPRVCRLLKWKKRTEDTLCSVKGKLFGSANSTILDIAVESNNEYSKNSEPFYIAPEGTAVKQIISYKSPTVFQVSLKDDKKRLLWRQQAVKMSSIKPIELVPVSWKVFSGLDGGIRVTLNSSAGKEKVVLSVKSKSTGKEVFRKTYNIKKKGRYVFFAKIPMRNWTTGKYQCRLSLKNSDDVKTELIELEKIAGNVVFNKYKWPVLDGKEFFPIGMMMPWPNFRDGSIIKEQSSELILQDLDKVKDAGFNSVILACPQSYFEKAVKTLNKAEKLGLNFIWSGASQTIKKRYCNSYKKLFGWYGLDEPEGRGISPQDARKNYLVSQEQSVKKYPVSMTHMWASALPEYCGSRDIIITDPYTIGSGRFLGQIVEYVRAMDNSCNGILPCWTILQFHRLGQIYMVPTPEQMRCQTFLALFAGVEGIFYYSTATPEEKGWRLFNDPVGIKTWNSMPRLIDDVMKYSKIYRNKPLKTSKSEDECEKHGIFWRVDKLGDKQILTLINSNKKEVSCKLPLKSEKYPQKLHPYEVRILEL